MASEYAAAWRDLRRCERTFFVVFITFAPGVLTLSWAFGILLGPHDDGPALVIAILWAAVGGIVAIRHGLFRCPRCRQPFFVTRLGFSNPLSRRCLHCKLPIYASNDTAVA
jgi:hypothetical protein